MFSVPSVLVVPLFSAGVAAPLAWPALGALFVWLLVLCLLGTAAGLMVRHGGVPSAPPEKRRSATVGVGFRPSPVHREAA